MLFINVLIQDFISTANRYSINNYSQKSWLNHFTMNDEVINLYTTFKARDILT